MITKSMRSPPVPRPPSQLLWFGIVPPVAQPRITRVTGEKLCSAAVTWALKQPEQPPVRNVSSATFAEAACADAQRREGGCQGHEAVREDCLDIF